MNSRDKFDGDRSEPDEVYLPGERYQPTRRPINWREVIFIFAGSVMITELARASGLTALWRRYVPVWGDGLVLVALGLFFFLRAGASAASRRADIIAGSVLVLIGASFSFFRA